MKLNKEKFLQTEFGAELKNCVLCWDKWLIEKDARAAYWCQAQWDVFQMAMRQFYGVEYHFSRTDDYVGVCTADEKDWLFKIDRSITSPATAD